MKDEGWRMWFGGCGLEDEGCRMMFGVWRNVYFKFCFLVRMILLIIFNKEVAFSFSS